MIPLQINSQNFNFFGGNWNLIIARLQPMDTLVPPRFTLVHTPIDFQLQKNKK